MSSKSVVACTTIQFLPGSQDKPYPWRFDWLRQLPDLAHQATIAG